MANTYVDYTAVASQTDYNFSFEYLRDDHVKGKGNDVIVTNYTIVTSPVQLIRFNTAPTAGAAIKIYRDSRGDFSPLVDFVNGSVLTESELDESYKHNLFVSQEASEGQGGEQLTKKGLTNYDAEGNKIINLGTPTASTDAANKAYTDQTVDAAIALGGSPAIVSLGGYDVTALGSTRARSLADRFGDVVNVKDYGAVGDGSTDDLDAIQAAFTEITERGGGTLVFPVSDGNYNVSETLYFKTAGGSLPSIGVVIIFEDSSSYLKLTQATAGGGMIAIGAGSHAKWINPRFDGNNIPGQNGIGVNSNCKIEIEGGFFVNFPVETVGYTGGKPIANDGWGAFISVYGTKFDNCHSALNFKRDIVTDASSESCQIVVDSVIAENCDMFMYLGMKNTQSNDGSLFSVSVTNFNCFNCGSLGGVFVFDRASNVKITNGSISCDSSYNGGSAVASIFRGRGRKLSIDNIQINQDATSVINIDPLTNYSIDTSLMADNDYQITATGTYTYIFESDLTDSTHNNRWLNNTHMDFLLSNDVTTSFVTAATRNGNSWLTVKKDLKRLTALVANYNANYSTFADISDYPVSDWTPVVEGTGSAGSLAYTSNGKIKKLDTITHVEGHVSFTNKGSYTGDVVISGASLPNAIYGAHGTVYLRFVTPTSTAYNLSCQIGDTHTNKIIFEYSISGTGGGRLDWSELSNTSEIHFSITYFS